MTKFSYNLSEQILYLKYYWNLSCKILIGASSSKIFHLNEFAKELIKLGIETKVVFDADYSDGFPSRRIKHWIKPKRHLKN